MPGLVVAIVITHNRKDEVLECIDSLLASTYENLEVVVLDNGSTDGTSGHIRERFPQVKLLAVEKNLGAAGGRNYAVENCLRFDPQFAYFVDSDAVVRPETLGRLIDFLEMTPACALAGSIVMDRDRPTVAQAMGANFDGARLKVRHLDQPESSSPYAAEVVSTCSAAIDFHRLRSLGPLDERFFVYHEDVDFSLRALSAGFRNYILPNSVAYHKGGPTKSTPFILYFKVRNLLLLAEKHGYIKGPWDYNVLRSVFAECWDSLLRGSTLRLTKCAACIIGWAHYRARSFATGPAGLRKAEDEFWENRFWRRVYRSSVWRLLKSWKARLWRTT